MSAVAKQHIILCEGYDDRSFWKGWLLHLGCLDPTQGGKNSASDAWGRPVRGRGRYLFRTPAGSSVIVHPFDGRSKARRAVEEYLGGKQAPEPSRVLLNLDCDGESVEDLSAEDQIRGIAQALGAEGESPFKVGSSILYSVIWKCADAEPTPGLPTKQTLERLVAAAIRAANLDRGATVQAWLEAAPPGYLLPKSYGHSYYAKWYSDHGEGYFFEQLWRDPAVVVQLEQRLEASGAAEIVAALVSD